MKTLAFVAALAAFAAFAAPVRADISILDNNKTLDVDCAKDPEISLLGNHITITTKGVCTRITVAGNEDTVTGSATAAVVTGNHNTLTLAAVDDLTIDGNNNTVTVRKSAKLKAPRIANHGKDNHITAPK